MTRAMGSTMSTQSLWTQPRTGAVRSNENQSISISGHTAAGRTVLSNVEEVTHYQTARTHTLHNVMSVGKSGYLNTMSLQQWKWFCFISLWITFARFLPYVLMLFGSLHLFSYRVQKSGTIRHCVWCWALQIHLIWPDLTWQNMMTVTELRSLKYPWEANLFYHSNIQKHWHPYIFNTSDVGNKIELNKGVKMIDYHVYLI